MTAMTMSAILSPLFIYWNPDPIAFHIFSHGFRWYAICWAVGLLLGYFLMQRLYRQQNIPQDKFDPLFLYIFIGVIAGARLGHCLFYEPSYFLPRPLEIILPISHTATGWQCTGYAGLSSHGGVIGMIIAIVLYVRRYKVNFMRVLDNMGVCGPLVGFFIRMGNLFNSEIVGRPTDMPWGFIFAANGETFARHPGQLYEALAYFCFIFVMLFFYLRSRGVQEFRSSEHSKNSQLSTPNSQLSTKQVGTGFYFGLVLTLIFTFRFFIEYTKADQVDFEAVMPFNMGQLLSVPFVIIGVVCMKGISRK